MVQNIVSYAINIYPEVSVVFHLKLHIFKIISCAKTEVETKRYELARC